MNNHTIIISALILNLIPGPAIIYVSQQTMLNGLYTGLLAVTGISIGALIYASNYIFNILPIIPFAKANPLLLKLVAAIYLIYLGLTQLKAKIVFEHTKSAFSILLKGIVINILNPKVILYFVILIPQYIHMNEIIKNNSLYYSSALFPCVCFIINTIIALSLHSMRSYNNLAGNHAVLWINKLASILFISYGVFFLYVSIIGII